MAKLKMQKLTKVVLAAVMAMSICGTALAAQHPDNTRGRVVHVEYQNTTDSDGLNDPNINHPALNHDSDCGEYLHDTDLTVGDLNKVTDALVANEQMLNSQLKDEAAKRAAADVVSGSVVNTDIVLKKGDNSTVVIDASSLIGASSDTYVAAGSYDGDSQTITLERNNGKENIDIKLDNVAKASDVNNLEERVSTNETNIQNLDNRVTNNTTNITNLQGDVNNLEQRVSTNETNIQNLQGDTIKDGNFADNTITLNRNSGENAITMSGIASTTDVQNEAAKRAADDIVSGSLVDTNIVLTKGSGDEIKIDASSLVGSVTDTYVTEGSYASDSQTITLKRNNGKEDINIKLDDVAKAGDVTNLEQRVSTNETNIQNIDGRVTNNETNIKNLQGDVINGGTFADNTITLTRVSGENPVVIGDIASAQDLQSEVTRSTGKDDEHDAGIAANKKAIEDEVTRSTGKDDEHDAGIAANKKAIEDEVTRSTGKDDEHDAGIAANKKAIEDEVTRSTGKDDEHDAGIAANKKAIEDEVTRSTGKDDEHDAEIAANKKAIEDEVTRSTGKDDEHDAGIAANKAAIENEAKVRENADNVLTGEDIASGHMDGNTLVLNKNNKKTVEVDGIATTADLDNLQGQVSNNKTEIQNNKERIEKETKERQAEDKRLDERIDGVEQNVGNLGGEIRRLDGRINKGVALAIAHASLKPLQYDPHYKFSGAFGVGSFHGENAIAAGLFYQPNENIAFNLSISNCGSEKGFGGGVSIRFK